MILDRYKRLLVIGHNCFSKTGSNGRTLRNYIIGWPKDMLAQLYIHPEEPDFSMCERYFCLTDAEIIKSILNRKTAGHIIDASYKSYGNKTTNSISASKRNRYKNSAFYLIRELIWKCRLWNSKKLKNWLDEFKPEIILVQAGDAGFLFELASRIGKKYSAEIVIYNTEGYFFKNYSYLADNAITKLLYPLVHCKFKKAYSKLVFQSKIQIYNCDLLASDYEKVFHTKSAVIMNTSELTMEPVHRPKKLRFMYAGNLGLKRYESLIEFATVLHEFDSDFMIDVYGKIPNQNVEAALKGCKGIRIMGVIPYENLKRKLRETQYLLHIESFEEFYKEDLKYAFSTKIADSLASGACLFVYAPENIAVMQYLKDKNAAVLITQYQDLRYTIKDILGRSQKVESISNNGRMLAERNHHLEKNRKKFQRILLS